jgi:hypothetical protein
MHGGGALSAYPRGNGGVTEWEWWGDEVVWAFVERAQMWLPKICGRFWEDCAGFGALSFWRPNARRAEKKIVLPRFAN